MEMERREEAGNMADKKNSNNKNSKNAKKKKTDKLHGGLDLLGIAPGPVGPIADGVNAVIYLAEGDAKNAAASAFAAIPGIGDFSKAAKTVDKTVDVVKGVQKIDKAKDAAKIISKTGKNAAKAADTAKNAAKAVDAARNTVKVSKNVKKSPKSIKLPKRVEKKVKAALKIKSAKKGKMKTGAKKSQSRNNRKKTVKNKKNKDKKQQLKGKCFSGDMLVLTGSGYRLIQEIRKGDDIYARNAQTGMIGLRKVAEIYQNEAHTIHHIWLDGEEELKMTAYHPVYVKDRGWVKAIHLRQGDFLETMDGTSQVTKVEKTRHEEPVAVYNFHVEGWESYFVSEKRVYVHNGEGDCSGFGGKKNAPFNGYNPKPGERTIEGYVKKHANPEISLNTKSPNFNNHGGNVGGSFKRIGAGSHGGISPHVHHAKRNVGKNGDIFANMGKKTNDGSCASPTKKDVKQLYEYLNNGKYH